MRRLVPSSLAGQLALVLVLAALLGQIASFLIFADERRLVLQGIKREQISGRVVTAVELIASTPPELHEQITRATSTGQTRVWLADEPVVPDDDEAGGFWLQRRIAEPLGQLAQAVRVRRDPEAPQLWRPWHGDRMGMGGPWRREGPPPPRELEVAVLLADGRWLNARSELWPQPLAPARSAIVSTVATATLTIAVSLLMLQRLTRPLRALADAADRLGRGEDPPLLAARGPAEIRRTTQAFNLMRDRLKRFVADRTRMLAAVGHDLRTPITSLRLRAEFVGDEETRAKILDTLDDMQRMVEASLIFTREEASSETTRVVDLNALVESVCADLVDLGREIAVDTTERVALPCRPVGVKRAVRNLVENAVAYGSRARVAVNRLGRQRVSVTVDDDGPGIPDADLERVFEPFTRLEPSRSSETGGVGLGLAIARTIARAHGGDVKLSNRVGGGLRATLLLPLPGAELGEPARA